MLCICVRVRAMNGSNVADNCSEEEARDLDSAHCFLPNQIAGQQDFNVHWLFVPPFLQILQYDPIPHYCFQQPTFASS